jgi:predicted AAA+ superfamily ATPase
MDLKQYMLDKKAYLKLILPDVKPRSIKIVPSKSMITSIIGPRCTGKTYLFYS